MKLKAENKNETKGMKVSYFRSLLNWNIGDSCKKIKGGNKITTTKTLFHYVKRRKLNILDNFVVSCFQMRIQFTISPK